jgi:hypothetical protein
MGIMGDFWEWGGAGYVASLGVALVGQGSFTSTFLYDLSNQTVGPGPSFITADSGGAMIGNGTIVYHDPNRSSVQGLESAVWASLTAFSHVIAGDGGNGIQEVAAGDATMGLFAAFHTGGLTLDFSYSITFASAAIGAGIGINVPKAGLQAVGSAAKGYFYTLSVAFPSLTVTANDGPPAPSSFVIESTFSQFGAASNGAKAITQFMASSSDTQFSSQIYDFASSSPSAGPTFATSYPDYNAVSTGVGGTESAIFFEDYQIGSSIFSNTEAYSWASKTVSMSTRIPNQASATNPYYPVAGNSVPGYF